MSRKKLRSLVGVFAVVLMLCCVGTTTHAETREFTLTVTKSGYDQDAKSRRTLKAGGDKYENCFYVTPTSFSRTGKILLRSVRYDDTSVRTEWVTASKKNVTVHAYYMKTAKANKDYYLQGAYSSSSNNYSLTVEGRYTP